MDDAPEPGEHRTRCRWASGASALSTAYHDLEWGVPQGDEHRLFELLTLEGAQAGLSWETILKKRESYRKAFAGFDPKEVADFSDEHVARLVVDPSIVRHRGKIESVVTNARAISALRADGSSLAQVVWAAVDGVPRRNAWSSPTHVPARSDEADDLARTLKGLGFRFVGPTTCYSFMQAAGLVNDHTTDCFRWPTIDNPPV